jgi:protein SCO1
MRKSNYFWGIFLVLLFPIVCFLVVWNKGGNGHIKLPATFGTIDSIKTGTFKGKTLQDTFWRTVPNITVTNQLGKPANLFEDASNKFVLVNFFFTTCKTTCPQLSNHFKFLQTKYKKVDSVLAFASISVDPLHDSVPALRAFANALGANHDKWWICKTSTKKEVWNYMFNVLQAKDLNAADSNNEGNVHTNQWILLDKERNIRGYYNALDTIEIRRCADDISLLILEKKKGHFSNTTK